jgi:hypothetical protein
MKMVGKINSELDSIKNKQSGLDISIEDVILKLQRIKNKKVRRDMKEQKRSN